MIGCRAMNESEPSPNHEQNGKHSQKHSTSKYDDTLTRLLLSLANGQICLQYLLKQVNCQSCNCLQCWMCIQQMNPAVAAKIAGPAAGSTADLLLAVAMSLLECCLRLKIFQLSCLRFRRQTTRECWTFPGTASEMVCCYRSQCWHRFCGRSQLVCGGVKYSKTWQSLLLFADLRFVHSFKE